MVLRRIIGHTEIDFAHKALLKRRVVVAEVKEALIR